MNPNDSPLLPQGSFLEQKNKGRARAKIAVFVVLAIHGIGLMALLMQGCKPSSPSTLGTSGSDTNSTIPEFVSTNLPTLDDTNVSYSVPTNIPVPPDSLLSSASTSSVPPQPVTAGTTDHKIVKGDNFSTLAKNYHVSANAIREANPGVDPNKLKIGDTLHIPAPSTSAPAPAVSASGSNGGSQTTYTVKSGDNLIKIANQFGTSVKAIRAANGLKTDKIKVGDRLKIPARTTAGNGTSSATDSATTNSSQ